MRDSVVISDLLEHGFVSKVIGESKGPITGIKHDSRRVEPGDLFVAISGVHKEGLDYVSDAIRRGASAIVAEQPLPAQVPLLVADNALLALSQIATYLYHDPTANLDVVGITGTNGKTTTTYLTESMLSAAGANPAVIGTVSFRGPQGEDRATHTTPMADDLMRVIRRSVDSGATHLVLEVSSHALAMHRADGIHYRVAALTNLTQDHLDYHGDFKIYASAKRRLFEDLQPKVKVLNLDDSFGAQLNRELSGEIIGCSKKADSSAPIRALSYTSDRRGIRAEVMTPMGPIEMDSPLIGEHNLDNLLLSLGCGVGLELDLKLMAKALGNARGAPGRLERIDHPEEVLTLVDYAHTPDALDRVLQALQSITQKRLIVLFGCGGDRDNAKRPMMGGVAAQRADLLVLTSDNPRSESPQRILDQIEDGVKEYNVPLVDVAELREAERGYTVQSDRRLAIDIAINAARPGDTVLIAGKGHETVLIIADKRNPFDDRLETQKSIKRRFSKE